MEEIVIAILAKDKEYCLDFYLNCILNQTYDKKKIHLYIRTNDNKDNTQDILDNFITSDTLESLYKNKRLNCIGPMLKLTNNHWYSNFHNKTCELGYYKENDQYLSIWDRSIKGLIDVNTIHCTYFLNKEILKEVTYDDKSGRYEYAIMTHNFRMKGITQYLDNTKFYGFLYLNDRIELSFKDYIKEYWNDEYKEMNKL